MKTFNYKNLKHLVKTPYRLLIRNLLISLHPFHMLTSAKLNTTTQICSRLRRRALKSYCAYSGAKFPSADYHADHQPPQKIAEDLNITAGVLLPQCKWCSNKQSSCVKKARKNPGWETSSSDHVVTNGLLQFRFFKLFLPWPLLFDAILLNYF